MIGKRQWKRRSIGQRALSAVLSAVLAATSFACLGSVTGYAEDNVANGSSRSAVTNPYGLMDNIQDGTILHCFDWKYTDIMAELPNIAAAGFTSVQTSPAQPGGNHDPDAATGIWWWLYQPLSFSIGTNYLGTKDELQALCTAADQYGIKIIVDIVANHLAGDHTYIQDDLKDSQYWRPSQDNTYWNNVTNRYKTTHKDLGMPDIVSENAYVQQCVKAYVQELKSVGVDGLRWDTLKHIQVPSEDCDFFKTVLQDSGMYSYGESLGDPGGNNDTHNVALMTEYTSLMSVTDDVYGNKLRRAFATGNLSADYSTGNWVNRGMSANKLVYWGESHDTWSNDETGNGGDYYSYSNLTDQNIVDRVYAVMASRTDSTSLYFSRPDATIKNQILAGVKGSTHFTSLEVAAVNHFHNAFVGKSEYCSRYGNIVYTERGTKGVILVSAAGGVTDIAVPANRMADGTYTDQVSGNTFTVNGGYIMGTTDETGIAVVYNPNDIEDNAAPSTLYMKPNSKWTESCSRYAAYFFNNNNQNQWFSMTSAGSGVYSVATPAGNWTNVIFCGMNANSTNSWANKVYQTNDLAFPSGNNVLYIVKSGTGNNGGGDWDTYPYHTHTYSNTPVWHWNGTDSAVADFSCTQSGCSRHQYAEAASVKTIDSDGYHYTATVSFNGNTYTDVKTLPRTRTSVLYLKPNTNWTKANARLAAYVWSSGTEQKIWLTLTDDDGDGIYSADLPNYATIDWDGVIFCRMNPYYAQNAWGSSSDDPKRVWNQTADQVIPLNGNNCYEITESENNWDGTGTWNAYTPVVVHTHTYGAPEWIWEDDFSGASAVFACTGCDDEQYENAEVSVVLGDGICTYTAAVTRDGTDYTDIQTVNDVTAAMLSKCEAYKKLSTDNQGLYRRLLTFARSVVRGEQTSSVFTYTPDFQTTWTSAELGLGSTATSDEAFAAVSTKITELFPYSNRSDMEAIMNALMADWPYEFYWFASKKGYTYSQETVGLSGYGSTGAWTITLSAQPSFNVTMQVSLNYQNGTTTSFDTTAINTVKNTVPAIAQTIVTQYANASDYAKLQGYAQAICQATDYNNLAAAGGTNTYDVDPWQLVYVFDNKPATTVVCEGYSKAFKYLCDLTTFNSSLVKCYLVSGTLGGFDSNGKISYGAHMWNVVTMEDGKNYLVDVTNSDECTGRSDANDAFILNGGDTDDNGLYVMDNRDSTYDDTLYFLYDAETEALWGDGILTLSSTNYEATTTTYTVTWENWDGNVLETDTDVEAGTMPSYNGATPTRVDTAQYTYTFAGWSPTITAVTGDVTYTATFTETARQYTITWKMDDGSTIDTTTVAYGATPTHTDAVKNADAQYTYTFNGWTPSITAVTGEATYTAQFTATPIQTETIYYLVGAMNGWAENPDYVFVRNEGCTTAEEYMLTNVELAANAEFKVKSSKNDWFPGGSTPNDTVTAAGTYTIYFRPNWDGTGSWYYGAIYAQNVTPYTVIFDPANNDAVTTRTVTYGNTATAPETAPTKYGYDFVGWYNGDEAYDFTTPVTSNLTLTAHWEETQVSITYTDINGIDTVTRVGMLTGTYTLPAAPYLDGYDFDGWTVNSVPYKDKDNAVAQINYLVRNGSPVAVRVVYNKQAATYKLIVANGTIKDTDGTTESRYQASEQIYVVADDDSEGHIFSCWKASYGGTDEVVVGYERTYVFRMPTKGITLTACYVSQAEDVADKCGTGYIETVKKLAANKMSFVSILSVPNGCQMLKAGIVVQKASELDGEELTTANAKATRFSDTSNNHYSLFKYTWTLTTSNTTTEWSVRPYLEYRDQNNVVQTVYGDTVTASLSSIS